MAELEKAAPKRRLGASAPKGTSKGGSMSAPAVVAKKRIVPSPAPAAVRSSGSSAGSAFVLDVDSASVAPPDGSSLASVRSMKTSASAKKSVRGSPLGPAPSVVDIESTLDIVKLLSGSADLRSVNGVPFLARPTRFAAVDGVVVVIQNSLCCDLMCSCCAWAFMLRLHRE